MDIKLPKDLLSYLTKAFEGLKPCVAIVVNAIGYVMFPEKALMLALSMVLGAAMLDIVTKYMALSKKSGGYFNAVKEGKLSSKALWDGTRTKIFAYLIVAMLTGMSYRVIYLQQIGMFLASFVYTIMFLREFQSNIENLCEAGADLKWLLVYAKRQEKNAMEHYNKKQPTQPDRSNNDDIRI